MAYLLRSYIIPFLGALTIGISTLGVYIASQATTPLSTEFFDTKPSNTPVSYVYAPGIFGTEMLMARYCPSFIASTGERVSCTSGGHVINYPHSAVAFPEIDLRKPGYFTLNPFTWIMNNIRGDLFPLLARIFHESFGLTVEDNPNSSLSVINYGFNFSQANGGQAKDVKALRKTIERHRKEHPNTDIILYGDSRGADTIFNYLTEYKPTDVKAAVLEGLTDESAHQIKHFIYSDKDPRTEKRLIDLSNLMGKEVLSPRKNAEIISDNIPLLFVISLKDSLVAPQGVFYVYKKLKARGHSKVHILVLQKSLHPCYMISHDDDRTLYETVVHAFYKHYNLPHNSAKAAQGYNAFLATQPSAQELQQRYRLPCCEKC